MLESRAAEPLVYLIDDDVDVRESLAWMLEAYGFRVEPFSTPVAFLDATLEVGPQCIVLDLRLPVLSGIEVLERLRKRGDTTPVLLITGHGDTKAAAEARALGVFDFLEKPFDDRFFIKRIRDALDTWRPATT